VTILKIAIVLMTLLGLAAIDTHACSCNSYGVPRKDAKEYYAKKFDGAIFTGTVASIKHDPAFEDGGITFSDLTVNVNQYWLGVTKPTVVLKVHGPNSTCWFNWRVGDERFFVAGESDGIFYDAYCDLANWMPFNSKVSFAEYTTSLLGKPKSFTKSK
jgi:hypothetical protein